MLLRGLSRKRMFLWDKKPWGQELVVSVMGEGSVYTGARAGARHRMLFCAVAASGLRGRLTLHHL